MPSSKGKTEDKSSRNITDFFKKFQAPPAKVPPESDDEDISDEIVVAAPSQSSVANVNRKSDHAAALTPRRGPGRPRKGLTTNIGTQSSGMSTPKRGPGRPRKDAAAEKSLQTVVDISSDDSSQPGGLTSSSSSASGVDEVLDRGPTLAPASTAVARGNFEAVLVHSPKIKRTTDVTMPPSQATNAPRNLTTLSFSSTGSLSTAPISTQSSSMRIVKDGMQAVTNSESDSGDSSGEDLADVRDLFPVKRRKLTPSPKSKTATPGGSVRRSARTSATPRTIGSVHLQPEFGQPLSTKKYKYDLAKMAAQAKKRDLADARIAELELSAQKHDDHSPSSDGKGTFSDEGKAFVAATVGSDVDEQERMMQALDRTEALQQAEKFYFFLDDKPVHDAKPFPVDALPPERYFDPLRSEGSRASAFTTGYVRSLAAFVPLPPAVIDWMMHQIPHEKETLLCEAYVLTLTDLACKGHVLNSLKKVSEFYNTVSLFRDTPPGREIIDRPHGLASIVRLVSVCAPAYDEHNGDHKMAVDALIDLALLGLDDRISRDATFCMILEQCIEDLVEGMSEKALAVLIGQLVGTLFQTERMSLLTRCRLIASLPATTSNISKIRRQLALESFSAPHTPGMPRNARRDWPEMLLEALKTDPNLRISDSADYKLIQALAVVFDIAVGAGFTPYEQLVPESSTTIAPGPFGKREAPQTDAAKAHDKFIDGITTELRAISSRIRGAGAAHLARTEAKSTIERVVVRLETSVRTKPKLRNDVFGGMGGTRSLTEFFGARGDGPVTIVERDKDDDASDEMDDEL